MDVALTMFVILIFTLLVALCLWRYHDEKVYHKANQFLIEHHNPSSTRFSPELVQSLPRPVKRFFNATIRPGAPLRTMVTLSMHGKLSLGDKRNPKYLPMKADELLVPPFGFTWKARAGSGLLHVAGSDAAYPGGSWTRFWLFGCIPIVRTRQSFDHALSAFGRLMSEAIFWTPASLLLLDSAQWEEVDIRTGKVHIERDGYSVEVYFVINDDGSLDRIWFERWSNVNAEKRYQFQSFGGFLSDFKWFDGYLLPTTVEAGNYFGSEQYFPFFIAHVDTLDFAQA